MRALEAGADFRMQRREHAVEIANVGPAAPTACATSAGAEKLFSVVG